MDVRVPKHRAIFETVRTQIESGVFGPGDRVPPDVKLMETFGASRPTVAKALQELERRGFVHRRPGVGTFVREQSGGGANFGLLIPGLGDTEIFEPICGAMARAAQETGHALLWGGDATFAADVAPSRNKGAAAWRMCQQYIRSGVGGVFFAPIELTDDKDQANQRIITALDEASIPVILLDRDYVAYPERSQHDLVGIDNRRVGYMITRHLIARGCKRVHFIARKGSASTVDARIAGFRDAISDQEIVGSEVVQRGDPRDLEFVQTVMKNCNPDGIVCANDVTAAWLMCSLQEIGVCVPDDVLIAGIDDVKYAELLRVGLTTVRQPCSAIGTAAFNAMLVRIEDPNGPSQDVLLACELVIRESTTRQAIENSK